MTLFMKGDVVVTSVLRQYFLLIVFLSKASVVGETNNDGVTVSEVFFLLNSSGSN